MTPITDLMAFDPALHCYKTGQHQHVDASLSRRLELDRAALMEALDGVMKHYRNIAGDCDDRDQAGEEIASLANAESALAAARANFPKP